jgi:hypothetical protein
MVTWQPPTSGGETVGSERTALDASVVDIRRGLAGLRCAVSHADRVDDLLRLVGVAHSLWRELVEIEDWALLKADRVPHGVASSGPLAGPSLNCESQGSDRGPRPPLEFKRRPDGRRGDPR